MGGERIGAVEARTLLAGGIVIVAIVTRGSAESSGGAASPLEAVGRGGRYKKYRPLFAGCRCDTRAGFGSMDRSSVCPDASGHGHRLGWAGPRAGKPDFKTMARTTTRHNSAIAQSPLETYLREINETALLTAREEKELAWAIADGDGEARDRMVRANLRLVVNIARGYTGKGLPLQDLIEEGNLGLLRAVEGFDPDMNTRFSTYASYWIKQSIKRALINSAKTIRIPAYMVELLSKWRKATAKLQDELDRTPTSEEVANYLGMPKKKLRMVKKAIQLYNTTPQTDSHDDGWSLGEMIADDRTPAPEENLLDGDSLNHVYRMLDEMEPREATILRLRFGLGDTDPKTLKEIGEILGLTRERVRQIEGESLRRLARSLSGE